MSTAKQIVTAALEVVLHNSWAVELPPSPTFPAIVFEIDTVTEGQWCMGGGYDQHEVTVVILAATQEAIEALKPQIRAAFEALASFMFEDGGQDADYEDDPNVSAYAMTFRLRTARY